MSSATRARPNPRCRICQCRDNLADNDAGGSMSKLKFTISISVDGYVAGPSQTNDNPLGEGGRACTSGRSPPRRSAAYRRRRRRAQRRFRRGRRVRREHRRQHHGPQHVRPDPRRLGRASGAAGGARTRPFHTPVYVLTHHAREPLEMGAARRSTSSPTASSRAGTGPRAAGDKDVSIAGGAIAQPVPGRRPRGRDAAARRAGRARRRRAAVRRSRRGTERIRVRAVGELAAGGALHLPPCGLKGTRRGG